jgi:hypothetical protein
MLLRLSVKQTNAGYDFVGSFSLSHFQNSPLNPTLKKCSFDQRIFFSETTQINDDLDTFGSFQKNSLLES